MANINVKIENLDEIRAAFRKSPASMIRNLNIAIQKSVFTLQAVSMRNTPVRTGRLRASHSSLFEPLKGILDVTAFYAIFVHDGTRYMKARPFLLEAAQTTQNEITGFFKGAVQDTLDEIAKEAK